MLVARMKARSAARLAGTRRNGKINNSGIFSLYPHGAGCNRVADFRDAMAATGITPPDEIIADGQLHRFASNGKPRDNAGWYIYFDGAFPAAGFGCWRMGINETWRAKNSHEFTPEEKRAYAARMHNIRNQRAVEEMKRHADAAQLAERIWNTARPAPSDHLYLLANRVQPHGLRVYAGSLVVPLKNGGLHSLQFIAGDGTKKFLTGGRVSGCAFSIGKLNGTLCVAEGFSTGASIYESSGHAVAIAFNAGNLLPVVKAIRAKFPELRLIVCADDDIGTAGNPGRTKAAEAALAVGGRVALPDFGADRPDGATDFNDLHRLRGKEAVRHCIENSIGVSRDD